MTYLLSRLSAVDGCGVASTKNQISFKSHVDLYSCFLLFSKVRDKKLNKATTSAIMIISEFKMSTNTGHGGILVSNVASHPGVPQNDVMRIPMAA